MPMNFHRWFLALYLIGILMLGTACSAETSSLNSQPTPADDNTVTETSPTMNQDNPQFPNLPRLEDSATVVLSVKGSPITIEVNGSDAPITAGNFVDLVQRGVYDGSAFHRVVREPQPFVVQGGDPQSKNPNIPAGRLGTGSFVDPETGQPRYIPLEIKVEGDEDTMVYGQTFEQAGITQEPELEHTRGAVAMARSQVPNSASAQFYIALADLPFLDGSYAVFGYVTEGMDVVETVQQGDRIDSARVVQGAENLVSGN